MNKLIRLWPFFAAVMSGALLAFCFPPFGFTNLIWIWLLLLLPTVWRGESKRYGFGIAYLSGLAFWLLNLKWIWTVSGLGAIGLACFLALYFGLWGMFAVSVGNPWRRKRSERKQKSSEASGAIEAKIAAKQTATKSQGLWGGALGDSLRSLKFALICAAAWVAIEWLRGWLFTGFGWNGLGVAFYETPILAQAADLVGVTGLAFTPVFMSAVLVQTGRRLAIEVKTGKLKPRLDFGVAALLVAVQFCYGVWRVHDVSGWETQRVRVLLIQENIPQHLKWDDGEVVNIMEGYKDSTTEALLKLDRENGAAISTLDGEEELEFKQPDWVIWPESALPYPMGFIEGEPGYFFSDAVNHLVKNEVQPLGNFTLISGMNELEVERVGNRFPWKENGGTYNSMVTITPDGNGGDFVATYRKMHLVLFGEYIPLKDELPFLGRLFEFSAGQAFGGNFSAGVSTEPLKLPTAEGEIQIIPNICFEDTVGRLTRKFVKREPQVIVNVTNDGWFNESEAAEQHMANARFRAIELRRPMIRSANTGVSGIVSMTGTFVDSATGQRQVIEDESGNHFVKDCLYGHAYAPAQGQLTLYALAGDWFAWLMGGLVVVVAARQCLGRT